MYLLSLFLWLVIISALSYSLKAKQNFPRNQHLHVIWTLWSGNPKGLSGPLKGGVILSYLSTRLNFTYEMVRVTENRLVPPENGRGLLSYLLDQQCDLILHDMIPTVRLNEIVDLTTYWIYGDLTFLIPISEETGNINALVKPFQWPVWLGLFASIVCVMGALNLMKRYTTIFRIKQRYRSETENTIHQSQNRNLFATRDQEENEYLYVFGTILSQGISFKPKRLSFRLVACVWALAAFIFVQSYSSILFTYIVTPVNKPLMNSVHDISENSDINVFIKIAGIPDTLLSEINHMDLYKPLRKRIYSSLRFRCNLTLECISLVTPGSKNVFIDVKNYVKDAIKGNFEKTGKCNLQMAKQGFLSSYSTFALPKNSPYTKFITQGVLELHQTGLLDFWDTWFRPMPPKCTGNNGEIQSPYRKSKSRNSSLSFKNLIGPFILFLTGVSLSLLVFLFEHIFFEKINSDHNASRTRS